MDFSRAALDAIKQSMTGQKSDKEGRKHFNAAAAELAEFLDRQGFYGEAAVMVAALTLVQDEDPKLGLKA